MITELDPKLVFDRFVVGPGSRVAATAARRTAESPGSSYNPLVICAPSGLGKTHLLSAIGHLAREVEPDLYVHYELVESFVDRLTAVITGGTIEEFREATGRMGLLLLDDLQQVAGKARTQEELLLTWDAMLERGSQVVVAADRMPQDIPGLDPRLAARLAGGLIVDVTPPEPETRLAIVAQLLSERRQSLPPKVVEAIARLPIENVRDLHGAVDRLLLVVREERRNISAEEVEDLVGLGGRTSARTDTEFGDFLSDISTAVAAVVETAPWRRRIAQAILRWEGEGIRTRRLENALDTDSAPDVDALLTGFARDVARLRELGAQMPMLPGDPLLLLDPDRLTEAEDLLAKTRAATRRQQEQPAPTPPQPVSASASADPWFFDREKIAWDWIALEERIVEEVA